MSQKLPPSLPPFHHHGWFHRATCHRPRPVDQAIVGQIRTLATEFASRRDHELATAQQFLRQEVADGCDLLHPTVMATSSAMTYEAIRRTTGLDYYDVQLLAGIALCTSAVAEMRTGEGKTLVAALPAVLHALRGHGVHVATVNAYLAQRDFELLQPAYEMLGLSVALLPEGGDTFQKRLAYDADITYGTGYEFGFDYLRDQARLRSQPVPRLGERFRRSLRGQFPAAGRGMQGDLAFAIIDEIDSVLLDEANTPLIISTDENANPMARDIQRRAAEVAASLQHGLHYLVKPRERTIVVTDAGHGTIFADSSSVPTVGLVRPWQSYVEQALRAQLLMRAGVDYIVRQGKIHLVDQYTGRIFTDRTWQDGLHQAVEWKEQVAVTSEKHATARISRQRFYGLYRQICGMTGTATGHESEFQEFYRLPIVVIPERIPCRRDHWPTRYFLNASDKCAAIAASTREVVDAGRAVLIGTRTIRESEALAAVLNSQGVPYHLLNGVQDQDEATLIARAGRPHTVTIATNMAGRGTDIKLHPDVARCGGLHVIATERQESRRVDRQLVGRAARQGDPGSCQFFVGADDELIQQFDATVGHQIRQVCGATKSPSAGVTSTVLDRAVGRLQHTAERFKYQQRWELHQHDKWLNEVLTTVAERTA